MRRYLPDRHPVFWHEVRRRMFGRRWFILPLVGVGFIVLLIGGYALLVGLTRGSDYSMDWDSLAWMALPFVWVLVYIFAPLLSASQIATERESGALELLFLTPLKSNEIVMQKYAAVVMPFGLLLLAVSPVAAYLMLQDIDNSRFVFYFLLLFPALAAACFCAIGLFISSIMRSGRSAMVVSFVAVVVGSFLLPIFIGFIGKTVDLLLGSEGMEGGLVTVFILLLLFITTLCLGAAIGMVERKRGESGYWQYTGTGLKKPQEG